MERGWSWSHATLDINELRFDECFGLMVYRELIEREDSRLSTRLKAACLEDIYDPSPRGLQTSLILQLGCGQWLRDGLIWMACDRQGRGGSVHYLCLAHLIEERAR